MADWIYFLGVAVMAVAGLVGTLISGRNSVKANELNIKNLQENTRKDLQQLEQNTVLRIDSLDRIYHAYEIKSSDNEKRKIKAFEQLERFGKWVILNYSFDYNGYFVRPTGNQITIEKLITEKKQ